MIKVVRGNLLEAKEEIIGHQVNCMGVMAAGLAWQLRNKHPAVYEAYQLKCNHATNKRALLGDLQLVPINNDRTIANLFGQYHFRSETQQTDDSALETSLRKLKRIAALSKRTIALPFGLGCGLANGDWNVVKKIIRNIFEDYGVTLYQL